jgi:hypothetical protein
MAAITRTQFRNALFDLLEAQKAATPTLLRKNHRYKPGGVNERPAAWVGQIVQNLAFRSGTRQHIFRADVTIATGFPTDNLTTADDFDAVVDAIIERATAAATTFVTGGVMYLDSIEDGEVEFSGSEATAIYRGTALAFRLEVWEGRV